MKTGETLSGLVIAGLAIALINGVIGTARHSVQRYKYDKYYNKNWKTEIIKKTSFQQQNKFKSCRLVTITTLVAGKNYGKKKSVVEWEGSCEDFLVKYDTKGTKPNKRWNTFSTVLTTEIQRRYVKEYRMIDSVGGMWVGSLDEMSDEIKTGNRFKKQKYKSFILKLAPYLQMRK